jgi:hypothetical protein
LDKVELSYRTEFAPLSEIAFRAMVIAMAGFMRRLNMSAAHALVDWMMEVYGLIWSDFFFAEIAN